MRPRHGGNLLHLQNLSGLPADRILDFSANINPLGPPEWLRSLISSSIDSLVHYPDPDSSALVDAVARHHRVGPEEVVVGNGSSELIYLLARALGGSRALVPVPSYCDYARACEAAGLTVKTVSPEIPSLEVPLAELDVRPGDLVFLGQPNNPTGLCLDPEAVRRLAERHPQARFLIDEAFADFVEGLDRLSCRRPANLIVLCSMTKFYAIPGLRLGYALGDPQAMAVLRQHVPCWSVNTLAQVVGRRALEDRDYADRTRKLVRRERSRLLQRLRAIPGLSPYPGEANFLLVRCDGDARELARRVLCEAGIAIRVCDNFEGLDTSFFRVAVRTREQNGKLVAALEAALGKRRRARPKSPTPALMLLGTSSNAGKSILTAAFCRILLQDGYRVAPFKSQNMSLNSFVTRDGAEMGRAQVVQAQACRLDPDVRMNPILLKPNTDTGSQVILMGRPVGVMEVEKYIRFKPQAARVAREAYDSLARESDVMVLEGAGSPAEINLKHHDIVNTAMARYAGARALLVGDIDRGGVFASFVGTMELLAGWERELVAGFIVNRFRGRQELLKEALTYTLRHTGRPVLGVVPYLSGLNLPDEDSVEFKSKRTANGSSRGELEIAVIDLPHISNFTDFDPLMLEPDVRLRVVRSPEDLNGPDAVLLPGSKNVIGDLGFLSRSGLRERILELAAGGTEVVGICGGFQMLGRRIADPHGLESRGTSLEALALLPVETELAPEKILRQVAARHVASGLVLRGYEIHHGRTEGSRAACVVREDGEVIGVGAGPIWGTYLHGLFDADEFRRWFLDRLRRRRGLEPVGRVSVPYDLEPALDRLALEVRQAMPVEEIYRMLGLA